ncbi:signal recognition particle protein, partial [bacterium]|nr:signal recognition particle protein [bacterium]
DSMTGQEAINVAKNFDEQLGITGVILTKLDGDTRGGAALSVVHSTGKPIKLIGTGEKIEPLEEFHPDRIASRILGMGDIVSLVEKAQKNIDIEETKKLEENIMKNRFSFNDFLKMQKQLKMLGSFGGILSMLPIKGLKSDDKDKISREGEAHLKRFEVMISSMTPKERLTPDLINGSRKERIAKGSGMDIKEVNALINEFNQMRSMMSMFSGMKQGKMPNMADVMNKMRNKKIKFK